MNNQSIVNGKPHQTKRNDVVGLAVRGQGMCTTIANVHCSWEKNQDSIDWEGHTVRDTCKEDF